MAKDIIRRDRRDRRGAFEAWLKDLRSGEFKRATGRLRRVDTAQAPVKHEGFCCLGVLCERARRDGGPQWKGGDVDPIFMGTGSRLPNVVLDFMGMTVAEQSHLISLNDSYKRSFKKIADVIEQEIMPKALARP